MGKSQIITKAQKLILEEAIRDDFLCSNFYFTGGTALSLYYLKHRQSVDLDFFSEKKFDPQRVFNRVSSWSRKYKFSFEIRNVENLYTYWLDFKDYGKLKVDFSHYPYRRLEKIKKAGRMEVDSTLDIAVNKITTIIQRIEVKDFVDLYYLLKKYTVWDLIEGVRIKFNMEVDPICLGNDFLLVNDFDVLPKMIKPLRLTTLQRFFTQKARETAGRVVEFD